MNENTTQNPELVINSSLVTQSHEALFYEFVLDDTLQVVECGFVESLVQGIISPVESITIDLNGMLFELNHVRVNPKLDNTRILSDFSGILAESGVSICSPPSVDLMAMCFKPLGELSDIVRFYVAPDEQLVFLSSAVKLRCV